MVTAQPEAGEVLRDGGDPDGALGVFMEAAGWPATSHGPHGAIGVAAGAEDRPQVWPFRPATRRSDQVTRHVVTLTGPEPCGPPRARGNDPRPSFAARVS